MTADEPTPTEADNTQLRQRVQQLTSYMDAFRMIGENGDGWQQMVAGIAYESYFHQTAYMGLRRTFEYTRERLAAAEDRNREYAEALTRVVAENREWYGHEKDQRPNRATAPAMYDAYVLAANPPDGVSARAGAFSLDPHQHAINAIESMQAIARQAFAATPEERGE